MADAQDEEEFAEGPPTLGPWVWEAMDPGLRRERLRELSVWVAWLVRTYPAVRQGLRPCWWRHRDVREVLTALYAGWVRTYTGEPQRDLAEAEWISTLRSFAPDLQIKLCSASRHEEAPAETWSTQDLDMELDLSEVGTLPARHPAADAAARYSAALAMAATDAPPRRS